MAAFSFFCRKFAIKLQIKKMTTDRIKVGLYVPLSIDQFSPVTAWNAIKLLESMGLECYYPTELTSCGMEMYHLGERETAKRLGEQMIEMYEDCHFVVSISSAAVVYMQQQFGKLFHNTTKHNSYRQFIDKCLDLSDFLVNVAHYSPTASFPHIVAYLDHCTTIRNYRCVAHPDVVGLKEEPRKLLSSVQGLKLMDMAQADVCCGYGGNFANEFTPISDSLAKRKIDHALSMNAEYIVSTEPSCLFHLQSYIDKRDIPLKCLYIADVLWSDKGTLQ